jgi:hypothetical protein
MKAGAAIKREASGMTKVYLALLRGINVGGKNKGNCSGPLSRRAAFGLTMGWLLV